MQIFRLMLTLAHIYRVLVIFDGFGSAALGRPCCVRDEEYVSHSIFAFVMLSHPFSFFL